MILIIYEAAFDCHQSEDGFTCRELNLRLYLFMMLGAVVSCGIQFALLVNSRAFFEPYFPITLTCSNLLFFPTQDGSAALALAAANGCTDCVRLLLACGANKEAKCPVRSRTM